MTTTTQPANWSIRRFPRNRALPYTLLAWCAFYLVIEGTVATVALLGGDVYDSEWDSYNSVWEGSTQGVRAIAVVTGLVLTGVYLRLHVAHGRTRLDFMKQATVYMMVCSAMLAALTTLGFLLERTLYRINDWPHDLSSEQVISMETGGITTTDLAYVFCTFWLMFGVWIVAGMLVSAGYRRLAAVGLLLTVPLALAMIIVVEDYVGTTSILGPAYKSTTDIAVSSLTVPLALVLTWALARRAAV